MSLDACTYMAILTSPEQSSIVDTIKRQGALTMLPTCSEHLVHLQLVQLVNAVGQDKG